jgi:endonuclease/exonuclease/phosphatase (EEP) superfamily protein YafD
VIVGLAEHDLSGVYRAVNGYEADGWNYKCVRKGVEKWRRRFDHVFASESLNAVSAQYLHEHDELSDHTPLLVEFKTPSRPTR